MLNNHRVTVCFIVWQFLVWLECIKTEGPNGLSSVDVGRWWSLRTCQMTAQLSCTTRSSSAAPIPSPYKCLPRSESRVSKGGIWYQAAGGFVGLGFHQSFVTLLSWAKTLIEACSGRKRTGPWSPHRCPLCISFVVEGVLQPPFFFSNGTVLISMAYGGG